VSICIHVCAWYTGISNRATTTQPFAPNTYRRDGWRLYKSMVWLYREISRKPNAKRHACQRETTAGAIREAFVSLWLARQRQIGVVVFVSQRIRCQSI